MKLAHLPKTYAALWVASISFFMLNRYDLIPRFAWSIERLILLALTILLIILGVPTLKYLFDQKKTPHVALTAVTLLPIVYWLYIFIVD